MGAIRELFADFFGILGEFRVFRNIFGINDYSSVDYLPDYDQLPASYWRGLPADAKMTLRSGMEESMELEKYIAELNKPPKTTIRPQVRTQEASRAKLPSDKVRGEDKPREDSLEEKIRESDD